MIGKIKGILSEIDDILALIETPSGLSYYVYLSLDILKQQKIGHPIEVYTYLQVREDNLTLYGFKNKKQYKMFQLLLKVSGVGPKSAFTIISHKDAEGILKAVKQNNADFFGDISGIGRKTAQKILLELSQKLGQTFDLSAFTLSDEDVMVVDALVSLGFQKHEAGKALSKLEKELSIEEKIKEAIRLMTKKS